MLAIRTSPNPRSLVAALISLQRRTQLSFQMWTNQMQDTFNSKKGDAALRQKDLKAAIESFTQSINVGTMVSPTAYAR